MRLAIAALLLVAACLPRYRDYLRKTYGETSWTEHGLDVAVNGYAVDRAAFSAYIADLFERYQKALAGEGVTCDVTAKLERTRVSWQSMPFQDERMETPIARLTDRAGGVFAVRVGFREDLAQTALGHELGHVILAMCGTDYSESGLKTFARAHGLPY